MGYTESVDFPAARGELQGPCDLVVCKLDNGLTSMKASTYLGGTGVEHDSYFHLVHDGNDCLFLAGFPLGFGLLAEVDVHDRQDGHGDQEEGKPAVLIFHRDLF